MNYSEKEKEAIERLDRKLTSEKFTKNIGMPVYIKDVEIVLNLIQKQEFIIDKIWDLYYEYLSIRPASGMKFLKSKGFDVSKCEKCSFDDDNINCKECIKEYFKKVVDEDVKD